MPSEDESRPSTGCTNRPALANPNVVSSPPTTFVRTALDSAPTTRPSTTPLSPWPASTTQESSSDGMSCVRRSFSRYNFPEEVTDILMASWRTGTKNSMPHSLKNGWHFVVKGKIISIHHHWAMPFNFSRGYFVKGLATQPLILLALPCLPFLRLTGGKLW